MEVFTQRLQNFLPGLSPFTYHCVFTAAEPLVDPGQRVEKKQPLSPPLPFWYLIGLVPGSHHSPTDGVPAGKGRRGVGETAVSHSWRGQTELAKSRKL